MSRDRTYYTKHGMRMNSLGKKLMCQEITKTILDLLLPESDNLPIPLYWKAFHSIDPTYQYSSNSVVDS
jgi:ribosomal protein S7